tara:strand:- start:189 stop:1154 length:966 start_codon:yes stop_codon:yes gene_type:complete
MSSDITSEETEEVELTEKDLDVIDEINQENEPEETIGGDDEQSVTTREVDEPQFSQDAEVDADPADDNLAKWANYYGINPDDYSNEDALRRQVASTSRYYEQVRQAQQLQQQPTQQAPTDTQEEQVAKQFRVGLGDDYDEGLREKINELAGEMQQHYDSQMAVLAQAVLGQQEFIGSRQQEQRTAQYKSELDSFNDAVGTIGNEELFGESGYQDLAQGSTESRNREQLYDQVLVLASGYQQQGRQMPAMGDLVNQAYRTTFSNEVDNQSRKSFNNRLRKQAKRRLGSGSSAKKTSVPTDDPVDNPALKEAFEGYLKDNGDL